MITIGICSSRGFSDYNLFCEKLNYLIQNLENYKFVSGGCKDSADELIQRFCHENNLELTEHLPDYEKYGKYAPLKRNTLIVNDSDYLVAFYDGKSRGTLDTINKFRKKDKNGDKFKIIKI